MLNWVSLGFCNQFKIHGLYFLDRGETKLAGGKQRNRSSNGYLLREGDDENELLSGNLLVPFA